MRRILREVEPARPSTALSTMAMNRPPRRWRRHGDDRARLANLIRGDLDWIVMKSLEKDRTRRYEPPTRWPPTSSVIWSTNLSSAVRRAQHIASTGSFAKQTRLAAAGAVLAALVIGLAVSTVSSSGEPGLSARHRSRTSWKSAEPSKQRADRDRALKAEVDSRDQTTAAKDAWSAARRKQLCRRNHVAFQALAENNLGRARELLDRQRPKAGEEDLRGFEWRHLWQPLPGR